MKRFIKDLRRYFKYALFQAKQDLKTEVANSYLNWLWWVLDPLCYMLIYTFVSVVVFKTTEPYFPVFVFLGLTYWEFFNRMILQSVKIVSNNKAIVTKVYVPKYILILNRIFVNGFKMLISFLLVFVMMLFYQVPLNYNFVWIIPITINFVLITFGISTIILHFGVFVEDLKHIMEIGLKFLFYFTGIFYAIERAVPKPYSYILLHANPVAYHIYALRNVVLYGGGIEIKWVFMWFVIGIISALLGIRCIYKYENTYVKVI